MKNSSPVLMSENEFRRAYWDTYPSDFDNMTIEQVDDFFSDAYQRYLIDNDPFAFGKGFDDVRVDNHEYTQMSLF